jgi:Asp-tRNA(Asn)/Glu-tRNA(Gln) amidotransferase A subunit family amidase
MPYGVNFMGRAFEEKKLFQISQAFETLTGLAETSALAPKEAKL